MGSIYILGGFFRFLYPQSFIDIFFFNDSIRCLLTLMLRVFYFIFFVVLSVGKNIFNYLINKINVFSVKIACQFSSGVSISG